MMKKDRKLLMLVLVVALAGTLVNFAYTERRFSQLEIQLKASDNTENISVQDL